MLLGPFLNNLTQKINAIGIRNTTEVELLGVVIDHKMTFDAYIDQSCKTARFQLHALRRFRKCETLVKRQSY